MTRSGRPLEGAPELRYLRSRANRRIRKARLNRSLMRWSAIGAAHLAITGLFLYAAVRLLTLVTNADEFTLTTVEVEGARRASPVAIRARLAPYIGRNLLELDLAEVAAVSARDSWALWASARRIFPGTLRVQIAERHPSATAILSGVAHVIDSEGYVIRPSGPGMEDDLPVLTGLDGMSQPQLIAALRRGAGFVERLRRTVPAVVDEISELDLSRRDAVAVRTIDPGPELLLDPARIERNLPEYLELRRDIARRGGPMVYVDLRWEDHITVMPTNGVPSKEAS